MPEREWGSYEESEAEEEFLEPLVIQGEEFLFPKTPAALPYWKLLDYENQHDGQPMPIGLAAVELLPDVLGCLDEAKRDSLLRKVKADKLPSLSADVLIKWGWFTVAKPEDAEAPNQEAPPASTDSSTEGSGRSKPISSPTTASV